MQRLATITAACAALIGVFAFAGINSAGEPGPAAASARYSAYAACGLGAHAAPAHKCTKGSKVGAFFKSTEPVVFKLCAKFPGGQRLCANDQSAKAGKLKVNKVTTNKLGRHKLTWILPDRKIVRYFRLIRS
jgi:hypothetical protein